MSLFFKFLLVSCLSVLTLLYFAPFSPRNLRLRQEIEIPPELPDRYLEPFRVKSYCNVNRGNSSKMPVAMSNSEHASLMDTLRQMTRLFGANDIKWMMSDGSMIGSLRHWDVIPWDDDFDVLIDVKDKEKLVNILKYTNIKDEYGLAWNLWSQEGIIHKLVKLYYWNSPKQREYGPGASWNYEMKHLWPFVDVFFYDKNETHLWYFEDKVYNDGSNDKNKTYKAANFIPLNSVFPLQLRPMGYYWLPAPRRPFIYLDALHPGGLDKVCYRGLWNHRWENPHESIILNCSDLWSDYFFVSRNCESDESVCIERLIRDDVIFGQLKYEN